MNWNHAFYTRQLEEDNNNTINDKNGKDYRHCMKLENVALIEEININVKYLHNSPPKWSYIFKENAMEWKESARMI